MALLELKDLHVALEDGTEIVKGVDLAVSTNEVHAVMGPNGSGKSTLAYALMGHPAYQITEGEILLDGENVLEMEADERAHRGLFLAFQYPHAVPGVTVTSFLRSAINSTRKAKNGGEDDPIAIPAFRTELLSQMDRLKVSRELASRYLNDGFSGGEMKRATSSVDNIASSAGASEMRSSRIVASDPVSTGSFCRQSLAVTCCVPADRVSE